MIGRGRRRSTLANLCGCGACGVCAAFQRQATKREREKYRACQVPLPPSATTARQREHSTVEATEPEPRMVPNRAYEDFRDAIGAFSQSSTAAPRLIVSRRGGA